MNNLNRAAFILILVMFSCKKSNQVLYADSGCIERIVIPVTAHNTNDSITAIANSLFAANNIDANRYRYAYYRNDSFQILYSPFTIYDEKLVSVDQYVNGLKLFWGDISYIFWNGQLNHSSGYVSKGTLLDTIPNLTIGQIRKLFLNDIEQFDHRPENLKDSCFKAEFGYYNLNDEHDPAAENLIKAWRITLKNSAPGSEYPVAFHRDEDGKLISYDDGIRTFNFTPPSN